MTADLLRQLDAYGDQLEAGIDHIAAEEVASAASATDTQPRRWRSRRLVAALGMAAVSVVIGLAGVSWLSGVESDSSSPNFDSVAHELGGGRGDTRPGTTPAAQGAAGLSAPTTSAEVATTRPPRVATTTFAPATTSAPTTTAPPRTGVTTTAPPSQTTPPALQGRDIVFVGTMVVAVTDHAASTDEVRRIAESFGGFVARSQTSTREGGVSTLTIRVLPSTFQTVLDRIGELGFVRSESVTSDDVTEVVVDLQSQIVTAQVSVERLRALLQDASGLEQITRLERELLDRERELERLRGQLRTVENQVALATITVTLTESLGSPRIDLAASRYVGGDGGSACPASGGRPEIGDELSVCLVVTNTGDVPLVDVRMSGDGVAAIRSGLSVTTGDLERLDPGDVAVLVGTTTAANPVTANFEVTGTPLNDAGDPVPSRNVSQARRISWNPRPAPEEPEPDTLVTAFQDGWDAFTDIGGRAFRVLAYVAPFLVFFAAMGWLVWWRRRRYWRRLDRTMGSGAPSAEVGDEDAID